MENEETRNENESRQSNIRNFFLSKRFLKPLIFVFIGAMGGFLYWYFIGCNSGTCPITSNPVNSVVAGSLMGLVAGL